MRGGCGNQWVIPCSELRPLILEWAHRNEYAQLPSWAAQRGGMAGAPDRVTLGMVLAHRSGVPQRRISGILNDSNETPNVTFDTADKLLCGMDMVDEWHDRLASYYEEPIEVSAAEAKRLNGKERAMRDLRDPDIVGTKLLLACAEQPEIQPSVLADRNGLTAPDWTGDELMSNDPALHHSMTSQVGNERIAGQA